MKTIQTLTWRPVAAMLLLIYLFAAACGSDKGKVESVNMLYGTDHKVWKTNKELDSTGDKVKQSDAQEDQELHIFANGNYTMTNGQGQSVSGKYEFDQAGKSIAFAPEGSATKNQFTVETLTDDKLTLVDSQSGAKLMLKAE